MPPTAPGLSGDKRFQVLIDTIDLTGKHRFQGVVEVIKTES